MTSTDSSDNTTMPHPLSRKLFIAMIVLAVAVIYLPIVGHNLHSDDFQRLADNSSLSANYFKTILTDNKSDGFYRPLNHLTFGLTYHLFGLNPYPYGVFNFLLVLGTCLLMFQIASRLTKDTLFAAVLVIAWLANVEVVASALTWAVGRTTGMEVLFGLLAIQFILMTETRNVVLCLALASFSTALAFLSKESGVIAGVFVLAAAFYQKAQTRRLSWMHIVGLGIVLTFLYAAYFYLRSHAVSWSPNSAPAYYQWYVIPLVLFQNAITCLVNSVALSFVILPLFWIITLGLERGASCPRRLIGALAVCIIGFGITLAPTMALPNASAERMYRYAYFPSMFAIAGMVLLLKCSRRWSALAEAPRRCLLGLIVMISVTAPLSWWHGYQTHKEQRYTLAWVKTIKDSIPQPPPPAIAIKYSPSFFVNLDLIRDKSDFTDLELALKLDGINTRVLLNPEDDDPKQPYFTLLPAWPRFEFRYIDNRLTLGPLIPLGGRNIRSRPIWIVMTPKDGGEDVAVGESMVRYWDGKGFKTPITLSHGGSRHLAAGRHFAVFRYRAETPRRAYKNTWGRFSVHIPSEQKPIAEVEIQQTATVPGLFITQAVPFETGTNGIVEVRITGGDARLWMESVSFAPRS